DRAHRYAGPTINALHGIDVQLRDLIEARATVIIGCVLLRVDAIYGTGIDTSGVLCPDTGFGRSEERRVGKECRYRCSTWFSSRRRHTRWPRDWSSDVCSSDLTGHTGTQAPQSMHSTGSMYSCGTSSKPGRPSL